MTAWCLARDLMRSNGAKYPTAAAELALDTLLSAVTVAVRPDGAEHVLGEVARGVSGGLLFAGVKTLARLSRPWRAGSPWWSWWCCGWAISRQECRCGLVGGFLLGLVLAVLG